jgi:hypothetical protein
MESHRLSGKRRAVPERIIDTKCVQGLESRRYKVDGETNESNLSEAEVGITGLTRPRAVYLRMVCLDADATVSLPQLI